MWMLDSQSPACLVWCGCGAGKGWRWSIFLYEIDFAALGCFLCFGNEASRDRYVGRLVCLSVGLSVCRSVSTQLSKKFKRCRARSILYSLCTLVRALVQYMCTHSCGQSTVRNRARILLWALTLKSFAVMGYLSEPNISSPKLSRPKHIPACRSVLSQNMSDRQA